MKRTTLMFVIVAGAALPAPAFGAASPAVSKLAPGTIGHNSAVLRDAVNPEGSPTHYFFQWGLTIAYGGMSTPASAGAGTKSVAVSATASGLLPGTVYHYRVIAQNGVGQTVGADQTLRTGGPPPPTVATGTATAVARNTATLTGLVNPNNAVTTFEFQYGLTPSYGSTTSIGTVPAGAAPVTVATPIAGLQAGAPFHFRIVAFHGDSPPEYGTDQTFLTEPFPRPKPALTVASTPRRPGHRAFTLTTLGKVTGPASIPAADDCGGTVTVRVFDGRRQIAQGISSVGPSCTFAVTTAVPRLHGSSRRGHGGTVRLKVITIFAGNGYLAPRRADNQTISVRRP